MYLGGPNNTVHQINLNDANLAYDSILLGAFCFPFGEPQLMLVCRASTVTTRTVNPINATQEIVTVILKEPNRPFLYVVFGGTAAQTSTLFPSSLSLHHRSFINPFDRSWSARQD